MITADDLTFLRRAIDIAAAAITTGDDPYGSLLVGPQGKVLIEAHNTVRRDNDITAHPELKLARWAARELDPDTAARTTMYTSCQPCGMCGGAIDVPGSAASSTRSQPSSGRSSIPVLVAERAQRRASPVRRGTHPHRPLPPAVTPVRVWRRR